MGETTDASSFNPHREEDEGYLAAEAGQGSTDNPYPRGTIRYEEWRRGWQIKRDETQRAIRLADSRRGPKNAPHGSEPEDQTS